MPFWFSVVLIGGITFALFRVVIPVVLSFHKLSRVVFLCGDQIKAQPENAVPQEISKHFEEAIAILRTLEFKLVGYYTVMLTEGEPHQWSIFCQDASQQIHGAIVLRPPVNGKEVPANISFTTILPSDVRLVTVNSASPDIYPPAPNQERHYHKGADLDTLVKIHRHQLNQQSQTAAPQPLTAEQYIAKHQLLEIKELERLSQLGKIVWLRPQVSYRMSRQTILRIIINFFVKKKAQETEDESLPSLDLASQCETFKQQQINKSSGLSRRTRNGLFLGTLAFFIASYAVSFDIQTLLIFVAALLFHEAGHVLAMKHFGYRDVSMLFIPYLGALATAHKKEATLSEKVWVSLAGPLPGLCLALIFTIILQMGWVGTHPWVMNGMTQAIPMLLVLNLFNLLPMYPLDGGQVAELLLFSHRPYLGSAFRIAGIGALSLIALGLNSPVMLVFAGLIGCTLPVSFRLAKLNGQLQKSLKSETLDVQEEDAADRLIFLALQRLQQEPYQKLSFAQKSTLVNGVLANRMSSRAPITTRVGLSAIYGVSLVMALGGSVASVWLLPMIGANSEISAKTLENEPEVSISAAPMSHQCVVAKSGNESRQAQQGQSISNRQITLVGTFNNAKQAQSFLQTIQPQLGATDPHQQFGQLILVSTFSEQTRNKINILMQQANATVSIADPLFSEESLSLRLTADAPTSQQAYEFAQSMTQFFTLSERFLGLSAPWETASPFETQSKSKEDAQRQANARYTYAKLLSFQTQAAEDYQEPPLLTLRMILATLTNNQQWLMSMEQRWQTEENRFMRSAVQDLAASGDEQVSTAVIDLFLEQLNVKTQLSQIGYAQIKDQSTKAPSSADTYKQQIATVQSSLSTINRQMSRQMGVAEASQNSGYGDGSSFESTGAFYGEVEHSGKTVQLALFSDTNPQKTLPAIAAYLCEQKFSNIRYDIGNSEM